MRLLAVLCVTAGCAATQQQQQPSETQTQTPERWYSLRAWIAEEVQRQLRPLKSQIDDFSRRLILLENGQSPQPSELTNRIDSQQVQLDELAATIDRNNTRLDDVIANMNSQESKLDEIDVKVDSQKAQLSGIVTEMNNQMSRLENLTTRLASQESQVAGLVVKLDSQQAQLASLNIERSGVDGAANETASQQTQIAELAVRLDQVAHQVEQMANPGSRDCSELPAGASTGIHLLRPGLGYSQSTVEAYCDMNTDGGNWTVVQRRDDIQPRQDFYLGWTEYKNGFGNLTGEFWWGLDYLWQLTSVKDRQYELRIDLEAFDGSTAHAVYQDFRISSENDGYLLRASNYSGDAGDGLQYYVNRQFSTRDRDHDGRPGRSCAEWQQGPWWYGERCGWSNLNGRYLGRDGYGWTGIYWYSWKRLQSLKKTEMKIRPT